MQQFKWLPTACSPERHPVRVLAGGFEFSDEPKVMIMPASICKYGWGEIGLVNLTENDFHSVPCRMDITWFSFLEDKFYKGSFDLPEQKIEQLFSKGFKSPSNDKEATYEYLIVGMAPNGLVALWAAGHGIVTELCVFQATETKIEWDKFIDKPSETRQEYVQRKIKSTLKDDDILWLKENAAFNRHWNKYHDRFQWAPVFLGNIEPINLWIFSTNGEREFIRLTNNVSSNLQPRSAIKKLIFRWKGVSGKKYVCYTDFDLQEVIAIFQKLEAYDVEATYQLQIEFNSVSNAVNIFLTSDTFLYEFAKCQVTVFSENK